MQGGESAEPSVRGASFPCRHQNKMLTGGCLDLNSVQFCSDSLKERLKETMINQELAFMGQVLELHRLYRIQIAMNEDIKQTGLEDYNFHVGGLNLISVNNNQIVSSKADFMELKNFNKQIQYSTPGCKHMPLDLRLSADEYIRQCHNASFGRDALEGSIQLSFDSNIPESDFDLNLSLSIGGAAEEAGREYSSRIEKRAFASSSDIIDLEDPNSSFSNIEADLGFSSGFAIAAETGSRDKGKLERYTSDKHTIQNFSKEGASNVVYGTTSSRSPTGLTFQRQTLSESGFDGTQGTTNSFANHQRSGLRGDIELDLNTVQSAGFDGNQVTANSFANHQRSGLRGDIELELNTVQSDGFDGNQGTATSFANHKRSGLRGGIELDLNTVPLEDDPSVTLNPLVTGLSTMSEKVLPVSAVASSDITTSWQKSEVSHGRNDVKTNNVQNFVETVGDKFSGGSNSELNGRKPIIIIDLVSDSDDELCNSFDPKLESVGSSSKLSNGLLVKNELGDRVGTVTDLEKGQSPLVLSHSNQYQTAAEQLDSKGCPNFFGSDGSQMTETIPTALIPEEPRFSESPESIIPISDKEPEEDGAARSAAESLVQMSLERRASHFGDLANSNLIEFQEADQPQGSSESYEAMVLKAKECSPDEYCISSDAFIFDESVNKKSKYKLKRGSRTKDFQKDILPLLSALERHEIREDINIIEGVMRSREYKKMRGNVDDVSDWCRSTRSKRSRIRR